MDSIVTQLTEIESAASAIVSHAESQKEVLEHEYQAKRKAFDDEIEQKTMAQVQEIRSNLEQKRSALLDSQSGGANCSIAALQKEYEEMHTQYAQAILERITEVS